MCDLRLVFVDAKTIDNPFWFDTTNCIFFQKLINWRQHRSLGVQPTIVVMNVFNGCTI